VSRPRILHVVLSLAPGGTERLVIEIARRLQPVMDSAVCCLDDAGAWAHELTDRGIDVVALSRRPGFHPSLGRRIADLARRLKCTVIHSHQYTPFVYSTLAAILNRELRFVFTEHGRLSDAPPSAKRRIATRLWLRARFPDAMFAVSEELRQYMCVAGFPGDRVGVVPNGIDPGVEVSAGSRAEARHALGLVNWAPVVGTVARLDPVKDLGTLVQAFARVRQQVPGARLVVVGDGVERARLEQHARQANLDGSVQFTGMRPDARLLLPAFDVYVNSSVSEGISLTILEAMAASLPVVATRVGGNPEVVDEDRTGTLVPPRDGEALASAMLSVVADPARRAAMGRAGRRRVVGRFSFQRMLDSYVGAYAPGEAN
jgi:glycosyltransferase involved in cell wall biosynthesis